MKGFIWILLISIFGFYAGVALGHLTNSKIKYALIFFIPSLGIVTLVAYYYFG